MSTFSMNILIGALALVYCLALLPRARRWSGVRRLAERRAKELRRRRRREVLEIFTASRERRRRNRRPRAESPHPPRDRRPHD